MEYTIEDIANIVSGKILQYNNKAIRDICIDSRKCCDSSLFIPIPGENTDGTGYIESSFENGAVCCIVQKEVQMLDGMGYILVEDSITALQQIATNYKLNFTIPTIGVTGSVGKTTAKDIISGVLQTTYNVHKTSGNYNSQTGVPMTVLSLKDSDEISVLEFGMDHFGEIDKTSKIASPDIACIMNIGICHIEYLKTQENIMRAKFEILNHMKPKSLVILNGDDKLLANVYTNKEIEDCKNKLLDKEVVYIGTNSNSDCVAHNVTVDYEKNEVHATIKYVDKTLDVKVPGVSTHLIYPTLAAFVIAYKLNVPIQNFNQGLQTYLRTPMRMEVINVSESTTIVDDTYNANPDSMKSLINAISNWNRKNRICILGPMRELGDKEKISHEDIGRCVMDSNLTECIFIGELMESAYNVSKQGNDVNIQYFGTKEAAYEYLKTLNLEDTVFGIKASRYYKFEEITSFLKQIYENRID